MPIHTAPWLDVAILPTSWRLRVLTQMLDRLDPVSAPIRRQRVEDIRAQVATTWETELQWRAQRDGPAPGKRTALPAIDRKIDLILGSISDAASRVMRAEPTHTAAHQAASSFLARFFPQGSAAVTSMHPEDELALALSLDEALGGELAQDAALIGLGYWAAKLKETLPEYEDAIDSPNKRSLHFTSLQIARRADHEAICRLIIYLLQHAIQHPADANENMELLALYSAASERIKGLRARRSNTAPDLDPNTGELIPTS
jgi:hypothetical protein